MSLRLGMSVLLLLLPVLLASGLPAAAQERQSASGSEFNPLDGPDAGRLGELSWFGNRTTPTRAFSIVAARWGAFDGWVDVTQKLRAEVKNQRLVVADLAQLLKDIEDPKFGHHKALVVVYQQHGTTRLKIVPSTGPAGRGGKLSLPENKPVTETDRRALHKKLVGTKWRIVKNSLTVEFADGKYSVSDWGERRGVWLASGPNRISGLAYEGSRNDAIFDPGFTTGTWTVDGKVFSRIVRVPKIEPQAAALDEPAFECVLGIYGHAIRGKREPFVNLRPPQRNLWTQEIESQLKGTLSYGEVDYIATAKLVIEETGVYDIDLPASGTQLRLNGHLVHRGELELRKGVYSVELYTNHWGQPYLKYAHAAVRKKDDRTRVPFVNTGDAIEQFLSRKIAGRVVTPVVNFKTNRVQPGAGKE